MPNWCNNYLRVFGPTKDITRFKEEVSTEDELLSFNKHVPVEEGSEYSCSEVWGTKWDACEVGLIANDDTSLNYTFDTAWSPPIEWLTVVASKFKTLQFELIYEEGGVGFYGRSYSENGETSNEFMSLDEWVESYDTAYKYYVRDVESLSREDIVKYFSKVENFEGCLRGTEMWPDKIIEDLSWDTMGGMYNYRPLAKHIISKIDVEDLPLFINVDWGEEYNKVFRDRLKDNL